MLGRVDIHPCQARGDNENQPTRKAKEDNEPWGAPGTIDWDPDRWTNDPAPWIRYVQNSGPLQRHRPGPPFVFHVIDVAASLKRSRPGF